LHKAHFTRWVCKNAPLAQDLSQLLIRWSRWSQSTTKMTAR
jgi:hypothetical protein